MCLTAEALDGDIWDKQAGWLHPSPITIYVICNSIGFFLQLYKHGGTLLQITPASVLSSSTSSVWKVNFLSYCTDAAIISLAHYRFVLLSNESINLPMAFECKHLLSGGFEVVCTGRGMAVNLLPDIVAKRCRSEEIYYSAYL